MSLLYNDAPDFIQSLRFTVYIGVLKMGFAKITGIETSVESDVIQQGGVNNYAYSLNAPHKTEKVMVFERGLAFSRGLASVSFTPGDRLADISIVLCDNRGVPVKIVFVTGGYVKKCTIGDLDAMNGAPIIERFEISYEMLTVSPLPLASIF